MQCRLFAAIGEVKAARGAARATLALRAELVSLRKRLGDGGVGSIPGRPNGYAAAAFDSGLPAHNRCVAGSDAHSWGSRIKD